ncbi:Lsr2 family protein [Actinocorallia longicatena]|uniref:Lsr2 family protein n=1 Tax=Actinocorallia longicatena TaxID=111803 RepID=A0ABN0Y8R4_9ACTN
MARETIVTLVDDLDGEVADETVAFSLDGTNYEIDLSNENAGILRERLADFVEHARRAPRSGSKASKPARSHSNRERSTDIRSWARGQGIKVNERGRIPASVVERYDAAH